MGRRKNEDGLMSGADPVWMALELMPSGMLRPAAASLARGRAPAHADLKLATQSCPGVIVFAEFPARHLVDFFPGIPVYCGTMDAGGGT